MFTVAKFYLQNNVVIHDGVLTFRQVARNTALVINTSGIGFYDFEYQTHIKNHLLTDHTDVVHAKSS